jgi:regulator of sirC expression with transglutaminase-like and TPR domain
VTDPNVFSQLQIGHQLDIPLTPVHFLTPLRTQIYV